MVSSYEGECLRLAYHGDDLSSECSATLFVTEKKKAKVHSIIFQTKTPRGVVSFNGSPQKKTSKMYLVNVNKVIRTEFNAEDSRAKPSVVNHEDPGHCDVDILPQENIRAICSANGKDGKMSLGEFKSKTRKVISCMEQFPK